MATRSEIGLRSQRCTKVHHLMTNKCPEASANQMIFRTIECHGHERVERQKLTTSEDEFHIDRQRIFRLMQWYNCSQ